jgi:hypothetical protein
LSVIAVACGSPEDHDISSIDQETDEQGVKATPEWKPDTTYKRGAKVQFSTKTWDCIRDHRSSVDAGPAMLPALWRIMGPAPTAEEQAMLDLRRKAALGSDVAIVSATSSQGVATINYVDRAYPFQFRIVYRHLGKESASVTRYVRVDEWRPYFERLVDAKTKSDQTRYDEEMFPALGLPPGESGRARLDGAAATALASSQGRLALAGALKGAPIRDAAAVCQRSCSRALADLSWAVGLGATAFCAPFAGPVSVACGLAAGIITWKAGPDDFKCFDNCRTCHNDMESSCKNSNQTPVECRHTPWICRNGGPVAKSGEEL